MKILIFRWRILKDDLLSSQKNLENKGFKTLILFLLFCDSDTILKKKNRQTRHRGTGRTAGCSLLDLERAAQALQPLQRGTGAVGSRALLLNRENSTYRTAQSLECSRCPRGRLHCHATGDLPGKRHQSDQLQAALGSALRIHSQKPCR